MAEAAPPSDTRRDTLSKDAAELNLIEFWKIRVDIEPLEPKKTAVPHCWHWRDIEPRLRAAAEIVPIEDCERRALILSNTAARIVMASVWESRIDEARDIYPVFRELFKRQEA